MNLHGGRKPNMTYLRRHVSGFLLTCLIPLSAHPHTQPNDLEEVIVSGRQTILIGEARSASEGVIGQMDLAIRPLLRPGDILEAVPGLIVTQHSGSGKSNQMFLRGFNLDHGTDFATWIDGMPVNMRTHGHGQGYTDINFLIPETIERMTFVKGPYHAELGDFSSAGGVNISTFDRLDNQLSAGLGQDGYRRLLAMGSTDLDSLTLSGALEGANYDGPWTDISEDVEKLNGLMTLVGGSDSQAWSSTLMYYQNKWNSADQIPERAVREGLISDLGSIDTATGGKTHRASLSGQYSIQNDNYRSQLSAYIIDYELDLWSNFTYFLEDPVNGDEFEQADDRTIYGGAYRLFWGGGDQHSLSHSLGVEFRYDDIDTVGLYNTRQRQRLNTVREDSVEEASVGLYYELSWDITDDWRTVVGIRGDYYWFDVDAQRPQNSGSDSDYIVSPKASLVYAISDVTEAYLSAGYGFHSNDARGVTIETDPVTGEPVSDVDALVQSKGAELGLKTVWRERWNASLALWYLELDSELLFVGDAGTTEPSRASERWGMEFNNYWSITDVWSIEADVAWTNAEFSEDASEGRDIPNALEWVMSGAISAQYPNGWFGSLRARHFDGAPLIEDGSVTSDGSTIANLALGWAGEHWRLQVDVLNLFDSSDHDIDYYYASRLPGEPAGGVEDLHFHVFEPRQVRAYLGLIF